ncbi:MAG: NAD-dependent epimerase/dehydratase family protein [Candidatus Cloacimonetes bacterium]|nr:NAD-dependent epimerase/dehydratase family protein [Candidatus Cloacimonadota bacterium]
MMKIGITGQSGFIGTHLFNYLGLQANIERIPFEDRYFESESSLDSFVSQCDVIVHLAAMNRHNDPEVIYNTNIELVKKLISSLERTNSQAHVFISSSTQEEKDNLYGKSKKDGRQLLIEWSKKVGAKFTGLIIPNVFGPFGNPFYNSFIATFCHRISHNELPEIHIDADIDLIYVQNLVKLIHELIIKSESNHKYLVPHSVTVRVSEALSKLYEFKKDYMDNGIFPRLDNYFELCLFNTFRSYIPQDYFPRKLKLNTDDRGSFVETVKTLGQGQFSFSTTKQGITRGDHFHLRKVERFAVIKGKARIQLRRIGTEEVINYFLDGSDPAYVDMPVWFTHNITNVGEDELVTLFWINEFFDPSDPDTYYEKV